MPKHSRKEQWLLALLALRHGHSVERDWLADTLWPDSEQGRVLLRDTLYDLRKALGSESSRLVARTKQTLALDLDGAEVDVSEFDAAVIRGDKSSLERAIVLYRGALLEGCTEHWVLSERLVREQAYLTALEKLANEALEAGCPTEAVGYLRRLIAVDTLRENAHCQLMQALANQGSYAELVQVYRDLRLLLRRELNVEPSSETASLFHRLRDGSTNLSQTRSVPVSTQPLAPQGVHHNLYPPLTSFVGREQEIAELKHLLTASRLLTITGSGGCGKTRLCLQVAADVLEAHRHGVWFVELAALSDAALVPRLLASTLGLRDEAGKPVVQTLLEFLANRNTLLILDNCEHLLAACAELADTVLKHCPLVKVLASSRAALGIAGEQLYRVPSLSLPELIPSLLAPDKGEIGQVTLEGMNESEAVRLFTERARSVEPTFKLIPANARALAQVCVRLDGIPLALELAAARVRSLSVDEINARLDDRFRLLTGGSKSALPRQQTLKALIDWDYDLLNYREKVLMAHLSVFSGGWTLHAAEAVCATRAAVERMESSGDVSPSESPMPPAECLEPDDVLDLLTSLVDKNMVLYAPKAESPGRYRFLESMRDYAGQRLRELGEGEVVRTRHRDYFLALALEASPKFSTAAQTEWLGRLQSEHENLRAALAWCSIDENGAGPGLRLAWALTRYWTIRGHWAEGRLHFERALEQDSSSADATVNPVSSRELFRSTSVDRARALLGTGSLAWYQGDYQTARTRTEDCLHLFREAGDTNGIARALANLSLVANSLGDVRTARPLLEESLALMRGLDDKRDIANALGNLGILASTQGDYAMARKHLTESLHMFKQSANNRGMAFALGGLGEVSFHEGNHIDARRLYQQSLELRRKVEDSWGIAVSLQYLGELEAAVGEFAEAHAFYGQSLALRRRLGDRTGIIGSLIRLASLAVRQGDSGLARLHLIQGLQLLGEVGNNAVVACALEVAVAIFSAQPLAMQTAQLSGSAYALRRRIGVPLPPCEREQFDQSVAAAREMLGEEAFLHGWNMGAEMTVEQAIALALESIESR